jgi:hypothetical protein
LVLIRVDNTLKKSVKHPTQHAKKQPTTKNKKQKIKITKLPFFPKIPFFDFLIF